MSLSYCLLADHHDVDSFVCGSSAQHNKLNSFLREKARSHKNELIGTTLIAFDKEGDGKTIAGYMTLLADSINVEDNQSIVGFFNQVLMRNKYNSYPALKIGRIAVHEGIQKRGVGTYLFQLAVAIAKQSNESMGIRFIVADSKEIAKDWYPKMNFKILDPKKPDFWYYDLLGWKGE